MTSRGGFTVLEQLVSLALLSVLAVGLTGALQFGIKVYTRAKTTTENGDILTSRGQFRRMLERTSSSQSLGDAPNEFDGDVHSISFLTWNRLDSATGIGPMRVYTSVVGEDLHLFVEPSGADNQAQSKQSTILSNGAGEPQFRYFDGETWFENWKDRGDLPKLVSMNFESDETSHQHDFVVELFYADE